MFQRRSVPDLLQIELAHTVGFPSYAHDRSAEPYLNYISNRNVSIRSTLEQYTRLVIAVVEFFQAADRSIQGLLEALATLSECFSDTTCGSQARQVLLVLVLSCAALSKTSHLWVQIFQPETGLRSAQNPSGYRVRPVAGRAGWERTIGLDARFVSTPLVAYHNTRGTSASCQALEYMDSISRP
jgi:hypothetical protein